jgi:prolyl-tRNA synthetase
MKQSQLFTKTKKSPPADEESKNAKLLIQAGYIHKEMAGVYSFLPLGIIVQNKIKQIVREEMNSIGGQELIMSTLQNKEVWEKTTRWQDDVVDCWFKTELKNGTQIGLGWSHEEPIVNAAKNFVDSYKDLPKIVYQFQNKLRNEVRAKSGIMRGREFIMKDMYSMHTSAEDLDKFYNSCIDAYKKVYDRLGIGQDTFVTFASGGAFTEFSHEFQTISDVGEDKIYVNKDRTVAVNEEVLDDKNLEKLGLSRSDLTEYRSAEVGNIFNFGTDKSEDMGLEFTDENGEKKFVYLGSYGIGITRVMGLIVEMKSDDRGIIWPKEIAPYSVHLVSLSKNQDEDSYKKSKELYDKLTNLGVDVLWDDRIGISAGEKFADSDLIGIPIRIVVSQKTVDQNKIEVKDRDSNQSKLVDQEELEKMLNLSIN